MSSRSINLTQKKTKKKPPSRPKHQSQILPFPFISSDDDDDDFQIPTTQIKPRSLCSQKSPLRPVSCSQRAAKKRRLSVSAGKENFRPISISCQKPRSEGSLGCGVVGLKLGSVDGLTSKGSDLGDGDGFSSVPEVFLGESDNGVRVDKVAESSIGESSIRVIGSNGYKMSGEDRLNSTLLSVDLDDGVDVRTSKGPGLGDEDRFGSVPEVFLGESNNGVSVDKVAESSMNGAFRVRSGCSAGEGLIRVIGCNGCKLSEDGRLNSTLLSVDLDDGVDVRTSKGPGLGDEDRFGSVPEVLLGESNNGVSIDKVAESSMNGAFRIRSSCSAGEGLIRVIGTGSNRYKMSGEDRLNSTLLSVDLDDAVDVRTSKGSDLGQDDRFGSEGLSLGSDNAVAEEFLGESSSGVRVDKVAELSMNSTFRAQSGCSADDSTIRAVGSEEDRLNSTLLSVDLDNAVDDEFLCGEEDGFELNENCSLDLIESSIDCSFAVQESCLNKVAEEGRVCFERDDSKKGLKLNGGYLCNSIEARLLRSRADCGVSVGKDKDIVLEEFEGGTQLEEGHVYFEIDDSKKGMKSNAGYLCNSIEARLLRSRADCGVSDDNDKDIMVEEIEGGTQLNVLLKLCTEVGQEDCAGGVDFHQQEREGLNGIDGLVCCPLCGVDISELTDEERQVHTNDCLDEEENGDQDVVLPDDDDVRDPQHPQKVINDSTIQPPRQTVDVSPVVQWLRSLDLDRYEEAFVREEVDWDTLQWLTEEDLYNIGVTTLGPRKKIVHALSEMKKERAHEAEIHTAGHAMTEQRKRTTNSVHKNSDALDTVVEETSKSIANKLITDFFPGSISDRTRACTTSGRQPRQEKSQQNSSKKTIPKKNNIKNRKIRDAPSWCCIPGTPFQVDAFRYLRRDCSHWFLSHFHMDHYQGLTRSFNHGKIYCSSITAKLVNLKIGIPWDKLEILPVNQKINISGIGVTCLDANHCPGSVIILFEPPNGKAILHTGDFRFSEEMAKSILEMGHIHTLILDTTYCNPQYDFPKQDAVIQFVIEAIQAETFNPKTLFLIGSYTIGKERLFLEVARVLRKKVHVPAAKLRILKCLGFSEEDMQWFTLNELESHIHVVPMWTLASFKRLKHISNQYASRFSLIVAFSPTGWTFGKGKKKTPGRRYQQGTVIRYEVPYSEHSSFEELKEFVQLVSPENIIPSVNNDGPDSANAMLSLLSSS